MKAGVLKIARSRLWSLGFACLLFGCGLKNRSEFDGNVGPGTGERDALSLATFTEVVHPVLSANCGACHGSTQTPTFALSNASAAWSIVESNGLVSFLDAASSRVVIKGGTAHGGCSDCNPGTAEDLRAAIAEWNFRLQEKEPVEVAPPPPDLANRQELASVAVTIPAASTTPVPMTLSLEPLGIAGGSIKFRISRFGTAFLLDRIQVVAGASAVEIEDVLPIANGTVLPSSAAWRSIKTVVGPQKTATVTTDAVLLAVNNLTSIGLSIQKVKTGATRTCKTAAAFASTVQPVVNNRCVGCHGVGGPGNGAWSAASGVCETFLERSVPGAFSKAATIGMPRLNFFGHPVTGLTDAEVGVFTAWYAQENL